MTRERLQAILSGFSDVRVLILGDLFLDKYLMVDPALAETSLETGLEAHQVVAVRTSPGAAGTVAANLRSLDVAHVTVLGITGDDGEGYDLRRGLERIGAAADLVTVAERMTPTYTKPMRLQPDGDAVEMNRLDHKNRLPLPVSVEAEIIARLRRRVPQVQAVIVADQVEERDCGVVTDAVREEIARLSLAYPAVLFFADSRERIGEFRGCVIKPNRREALRAVGAAEERTERAEAAAREMARRNGRPVLLTLSEEGIAVVDGEAVTHVPAVPVEGPIDPTGAGDSATAGIVASLCSGATLPEAVRIGNLVASLTVRQLGTTGTTTREAVRRQAELTP